MSSPEAVEFTRCWERDGPRLAAYARRHVVADDVQDVVAETFLAAWRRWDDVTDPPIAWLLGAARKVIGNHRRAGGRRDALQQRLVLQGAAASAEDAGLLAADRMAALEALAALPEQHREALLLVAWDGLTPDQAANVLGIRPSALRVRTHRARAALDDLSSTEHGAASTRTLREGGVA